MNKRKNYLKEYSKKYNEINKKILTEKKKVYIEINKDKIKKRQKEWYEINKAKILEERKKYRTQNESVIKIRKKSYYENNKIKIQEKAYTRDKNRRRTDKLYKLSKNIRSIVGNYIRRNGFAKNKKTEQILGCSFEFLKLHLESKFESWMSLDNYGSINGKPPTKEKQCWDIDHIIPASKAKTEEELIKLNHYTNLQPLCSYTNRWIKNK